jgi:uncharacterized membrane protein YeaQ/YmgE (transglycosylase-associated protein family)
MYIGGLLSWIILGGLAGWIASRLLGEHRGCAMNVVIGIFGALLGGFIFQRLFGVVYIFSFVLSLMVAVVGALVLLALVRAARGSRYRE